VGDVILGRVGHVREVANATLFASESSYCTGHAPHGRRRPDAMTVMGHD
jgi:hypothetical protein